VLGHLPRTPAQVFITATEPPALLQEWSSTYTRFHVEHAAIQLLE